MGQREVKYGLIPRHGAAASRHLLDATLYTIVSGDPGLADALLLKTDLAEVRFLPYDMKLEAGRVTTAGDSDDTGEFWWIR